MQATTDQQRPSQMRGSPNDLAVHFFEGTDDALLFNVRCYATTASSGPIVVPVPTSHPEEAKEFFHHGTRKDPNVPYYAPTQTPPRHGVHSNSLQNSITFFSNSSGVRLQGCSLYAIKNCDSGLYEVPEEPSDAFLKALEILREPPATRNDQAPPLVTMTHTTGRGEYRSAYNPGLYGRNLHGYPKNAISSSQWQ
ncbi:hypothetical protein VKT23_018209 [Stygiomarasmius scandens]|uniref:Uncharacterized protein n=1 Tax=Marasmiellus scandens TaxID=2682957 RepID=A0ABR1IT38_9AGAR